MKTQSEAERPIRAVDMVRRIRDARHERFGDRPLEERLAHYRERARAFRETVRRSPPRPARADG